MGGQRLPLLWAVNACPLLWPAEHHHLTVNACEVSNALYSNAGPEKSSRTVRLAQLLCIQRLGLLPPRDAVPRDNLHRMFLVEAWLTVPASREDRQRLQQTSVVRRSLQVCLAWPCRLQNRFSAVLAELPDWRLLQHLPRGIPPTASLARPGIRHRPRWGHAE